MGGGGDERATAPAPPRPAYPRRRSARVRATAAAAPTSPRRGHGGRRRAGRLPPRFPVGVRFPGGGGRLDKRFRFKLGARVSAPDCGTSRLASGQRAWARPLGPARRGAVRPGRMLTALPRQRRPPSPQPPPRPAPSPPLPSALEADRRPLGGPGRRGPARMWDRSRGPSLSPALGSRETSSGAQFLEALPHPASASSTPAGRTERGLARCARCVPGMYLFGL
ncbi:hypothetical protein H8959_011160 [Pygathrix nigripes]